MIALPAAMDNSPFSAFPYPYADWLHNTAAVGFSVAGFYIYMQAA